MQSKLIQKVHFTNGEQRDIFELINVDTGEKVYQSVGPYENANEKNIFRILGDEAMYLSLHECISFYTTLFNWKIKQIISNI